MHDPMLEPLIPGATLPPLGRWALFLDIDGTLIDLAATPDSVTIPADLHPTLSGLGRRFDGAVALVSGRALASIDRLLAPLLLAAAGQHGAEIRPSAGAETELLVESKIAPIVKALQHMEATHPGVLVEDKGLSVAVHFRKAPAAEEAIRRAVSEQAARSRRALEMIAGNMVWELRPRGIHKGTAVELLLSHPPFIGREPIVLGDDRTDEDAFAAAARLGGVGILVGPLRHTAAAFRLPTSESCRRWLAALAWGGPGDSRAE